MAQMRELFHRLAAQFDLDGNSDAPGPHGLSAFIVLKVCKPSDMPCTG